VPNYRKGERGQYQVVVSKKAWQNLKQTLKRITRKTTPKELYRTHPKADRCSTGLGELLPNGKYLSKTEGHRQLGAQQAQVLHMAPLEETRKEKEEPHPLGYIYWSGIRME